MINKNFSKVASVAAAAAAVAVSANPADAFTIGGNVDFNTVGTNTTATFSNATVVPDGDIGFSPAGTSVNVADLTLTQNSFLTATNDAVSGFISGFTYQGQAAVFDLFGGGDTVLISNTFGVISADITFHGAIKSLTGDLLANVTGGFSGAESNMNPNNNFSVDLAATPVPTPAMLPGLVGMGMAFARKRKQQAEAAA